MADAPASPRPTTVPLFRAAKGARRLAVVTAYDFTAARIADDAGADALLVGDSLGTVVQGYSHTLRVTLRQMAYHTEMVARAAPRALVIADLPFGSYGRSPGQAVKSAVVLIRAGAAAVKLEGGVRARPALEALRDADIPVMGHVGLTPQSVHRLGGFKVQRDAAAVAADLRAVADAGAFAAVVECVPTDLGAALTAAVDIPTIGIGAGPACDGQILVWHDLLGLYDGFRPRFVKRYAELGEAARAAVRAYCDDVRYGAFPAAEHGFQ